MYLVITKNPKPRIPNKEPKPIKDRSLTIPRTQTRKRIGAMPAIL